MRQKLSASPDASLVVASPGATLIHVWCRERGVSRLEYERPVQCIAISDEHLWVSVDADFDEAEIEYRSKRTLR